MQLPALATTNLGLWRGKRANGLTPDGPMHTPPSSPFLTADALLAYDEVPPALGAAKAAPEPKAPPLSNERSRGKYHQLSSLSFLFCGALTALTACPVLTTKILGIFVGSFAYRWVLHHDEPPAWAQAYYSIFKKLDGFAIIGFCVTWTTGLALLGLVTSFSVVVLLGDPHVMRVVVFLFTCFSVLTSLLRMGAWETALTFAVCVSVAIANFTFQYLDKTWTVKRLWCWHAFTATGIWCATSVFYALDPSTLGYPVKGVLYLKGL